MTDILKETKELIDICRRMNEYIIIYIFGVPKQKSDIL